MEPLIELPVKKWLELQKKLKVLWPLNVPGYYALYLNMKCPQVREAFQFKVYCPYGHMDNGFVGINVKPPSSQDIIVFSTTEDTSKLEEALVNTKLIDWSRKVCVDLVSSLILQRFLRLRPIVGWRMCEVGMAKTWYLDRRSKIFDLRYPQNTSVASIKKEHIQRVDEVWPYRFDGSHFYFSILASSNLSFGLYSSDELLAWVFLNEYNFLCHLYCEEKHRRKGYGEFLIKYVVNEELRRGNDIYGYVVVGNENPMKLFKKLGFDDVDEGAYLFVQK